MTIDRLHGHELDYIRCRPAHGHYEEPDFFGSNHQAVVPIASKIGRGPRGKGVTVAQVHSADGTYKFELVELYEDGSTGAVVARTPNLHAGLISIDVPNPSTVAAGSPFIFTINITRDGVTESYDIPAPPGMRGSIIFTGPKKARTTSHVYQFTRAELKYSLNGAHAAPDPLINDTVMFAVEDTQHNLSFAIGHILHIVGTDYVVAAPYLISTSGGSGSGFVMSVNTAGSETLIHVDNADAANPKISSTARLQASVAWTNQYRLSPTPADADPFIKVDKIGTSHYRIDTSDLAAIITDIHTDISNLQTASGVNSVDTIPTEIYLAVDNTDPLNPKLRTTSALATFVSNTNTALAGKVESVTVPATETYVAVDNTDPINPKVKSTQTLADDIYQAGRSGLDRVIGVAGNAPIIVDNTSPLAPKVGIDVTALGVQSVTATAGEVNVVVDNTDPANPTVGLANDATQVIENLKNTSVITAVNANSPITVTSPTPTGSVTVGLSENTLPIHKLITLDSSIASSETVDMLSFEVINPGTASSKVRLQGTSATSNVAFWVDQKYRDLTSTSQQYSWQANVPLIDFETIAPSIIYPHINDFTGYIEYTDLVTSTVRLRPFSGTIFFSVPPSVVFTISLHLGTYI